MAEMNSDERYTETSHSGQHGINGIRFTLVTKHQKRNKRQSRGNNKFQISDSKHYKLVIPERRETNKVGT